MGITSAKCFKKCNPFIGSSLVPFVDMKIHISPINSTEPAKRVQIPVRWNSEVNILIYIHLFFLLCYLIASHTALIGDELYLPEFIRHSIALPGASKESTHWFGNLFTYQFVHSSLVEFILSMSILWFFGHLLAAILGQRRVILLYLVSVVLSALAFLGSHIIFAIFSGNGMIMDGAFPGTLSIMTAAVAFMRDYRLQISKTFAPSFLTIYCIILAISLPFIFKPSMAYIFIYISGIIIGFRYAISSRMKVA